MNAEPFEKRQRRIPTWARVIAGLLALLSIPIALDTWHRASLSGHTPETTFVLVACVLCFLLFAFVSVSGREPRFFSAYTNNSLDGELAQKAFRGEITWLGSEAIPVVMVGVASALACFFLAKDYVFESDDQSAWIVFSLFFLAWVVLNVLFLIYSRHRFKRLRKLGAGRQDIVD